MTIHTLTVCVYHSPLGDCSNGGISSRFKELAIACPDGPNSFDPDTAIPLNFCMVQRRRFYTSSSQEVHEHLSVVPATVDEYGRIVPRPGWWMYGGNIADTSDGRWKALSAGYPLHIHDRKE